MANARVFEDLKSTLMNASSSQLNSHSTLKAAENLLQCLQRDGASTGGAISGYNDGGAKTAHYGMHYVDGGSGVHSSNGVMPYNDGGAAKHYANLRAMQNGGGASAHHNSSTYSGLAEAQRGTEGIMPGSSWAQRY